MEQGDVEKAFIEDMKNRYLEHKKSCYLRLLCLKREYEKFDKEYNEMTFDGFLNQHLDNYKLSNRY